METEVEPGVLLITANVGSIFEEPDHMMSVWLEKLFEMIQRLQPHFVALHCQELGGKNFEVSMQHVEKFIESFRDSEVLRDFDRSSFFLDKEFRNPETFTALGNLYFIHKKLKDIQCYDFKECKFRPVTGHELYSSNLASVTTQEKFKFPAHFFPECRWSRKGFLRTRWCISGRQFELVNVHLFHDASNVIAMQKYPSPYSKNRRKALEHVVQRISQGKHKKVPFFVFGDFNFRLDAQSVVNALVSQAKPEYTKEDGNITRIVYTSDENNTRVLLTLEKKKFEMDDPSRILSYGIDWLSRYDKERENFSNQLYEYDVEFRPSYPYSEDVSDGHSYMKTRLPAWCDRVFMSHSAKGLISDASTRATYSVIGQDVCMGDHKPVFLSFRLAASGANISGKHHTSRQAHCKCCLLQ